MTVIGTRRILRMVSGAEEETWDPSDLSDLKIWLDASDISYLYQDSAKTTPVTADGDVVGCWADKSGNGNDVVQATTANKPLYKTNIQNSLSALLFDGINDFLKNAFATGALSQPFHIVMVAKYVSYGNYDFLTGGDDVTNIVVIGTRLNNEIEFHVGKAIYANDLRDTNWNIWTGLANGASSDCRKNGTSVMSGNAGTENPDGLTVGAYSSGGNNANAYISELLIIDPNMSDDDRSSLESYLSSKWNIAIS